jgi:hypothetical protein
MDINDTANEGRVGFSPPSFFPKHEKGAPWRTYETVISIPLGQMFD